MKGIYQRGKMWYIDYYANGRRVREAIGENKKLAETVLKKRKVEVVEGKHLDIRKMQKIRFEDFSNTFLELHSKVNKKPSSYKKDKTLIKNLISFFAGRNLSEITPMIVEEYKTKRIQEGKKPATVNRGVACLKCMLNKAIEWGKAHNNPVTKVKLLRENNARLRFLEKEEIIKLLNNCPEHIKPIVIVAVNTGMRKGEILSLKWNDVDFDRSLIYLTNTKNSERREVPMNELVKRTLSAIPKHPESPYIFCNANGKPYGDIKKSFLTAVRKADILDFRFHDLRHTFASQLVMSGIDIKTVQELLGHKSIDMTLRYSHLSPSHKQRAVEVLGRKMDTIWSQEPKADDTKEDLSYCNSLPYDK